MPLTASYFLDVEYAHTHAFEYVGQNTEEPKTFFAKAAMVPFFHEF